MFVFTYYMYTHIYENKKNNERKCKKDRHEKERREYRCNCDLKLFVFQLSRNSLF